MQIKANKNAIFNSKEQIYVFIVKSYIVLVCKGTFQFNGCYVDYCQTRYIPQ